MIKKIGQIAVVLCLLALLIAPVCSPAIAAADQGSISVSNSKVTISFPLSMSFSCQIKSNVNITDVRLRYKVDQETVADVFTEGFVNITPSSSVSAKYDLDLRRFGGFPPGTSLHYWWAVKDANKSFLETAPQDYIVNDNRYTWKNLTQGNIKLYWYNGDNNFAQALMQSGQNALKKLAADTGASPSQPVSIFIYANSTDLQGSMIYPSEWTGGVSFTQYNIITIGISTSQLSWGETAMTHELTHNVIGQVVFNTFDDLPVWLNEGLAVYNQGGNIDQFTSAVSRAVKNNQLFTVKTLSSPFSADSEKANLSYGESYTLVSYLVSQYGSAKMFALLQAFKAGNTYDGAFQQVYGFNQDGLNTQWQAWVKTTYGK